MVGLTLVPSTGHAAEPVTSPTAIAAGPYSLTTGGAVALNGSLSTSNHGHITLYEWDINGDGKYGDLKGPTPVLAWSSFRLAPGARAISLRVTDSAGRRDTVSATVNVQQGRFALYDVFRYNTTAAGLLRTPVFGPDGRLYGMANDGAELVSGGVLWRMDREGRDFVVLKEFTLSESEYPQGIVFGSDNRIYGSYQTFPQGAVWRVNLDLTGFQMLRVFGTSGDLEEDGWYLAGVPCFGPDGRLYGACESDGLGYEGTIWRMNADGSGFVVLRHLGAAPASDPPEGLEPFGPVVFGPDGNLYGTTRRGGTFGLGTLWRMAPDGSGYRVLTSFGAGVAIGGLRFGPDGRLYGAGARRINADGTGYVVLHHFDDPAHGHDVPTPVFGRDGRLYGTVSGGTDGRARLWRMNSDGSDFVILLATDPMPSGTSLTDLVPGSDGRFYGAASFSEFDGVLWRTNRTYTGFEVLEDVARRYNAYDVGAPPVFSRSGELFGVTSTRYSPRVRTVWRVSPNSAGYSVLHELEFGAGGAFLPVSVSPTELVYGIDGWTIWRIRKDGTGFSVLRDFGAAPVGAPAFDLNGGVLFGMTEDAQLWRMAPDGSRFVQLRYFTPGFEGSGPSGTPLFHPDGWLFGAMKSGGASGGGTLWRVRPDGTRFAVLRAFLPAADGTDPADSPVAGPDGRVYGINKSGGAHGAGTLWRINRDGTQFSVRHHFGSTGGVGQPNGPPAFGSDGRIYGMSARASGGPVLWRMNADGTGFAIVDDLSTAPGSPYGAVRFGPDGRLYGVIEPAGMRDDHTIYSWSDRAP